MKLTIRKALRANRRALSTSEHHRRSSLAAAAITRLATFKSGAAVAIYLPFDRETDTTALIEAAQRRGVRLFVPVVTDLRHRRIAFYPYSARTRRGIFGIAVPRRHGRPLPPRWFDLIVVPLVGIDATGRRLGMGGGFYDRALEFRRRRAHWRGPLLIGYCFECQRADSVDADPWDVALDGVATESGLTLFRRDDPRGLP